MLKEEENKLSPTEIVNEKDYYTKADSKTDWEKGDLWRVKNFVNKQYDKFLKLNILEVGCGEATIIKHIDKNIQYNGIDPSPYCNDIVENSEHIKIEQGLAENLPYKDGQFDIVFSNHALEHFFDPEKSLEEMDRVVKKDGYIILLAPNHELPWTKLNAIRHYDKSKLIVFKLKRIFDLVKRMFGVSVFRLIPSNYTKSTKKYEKPDDDLVYVVSSYEVLRYFVDKKYSLIYAKAKKINSKSGINNLIKKIISSFPFLKYSTTNLFFILKK